MKKSVYIISVCVMFTIGLLFGFVAMNAPVQVDAAPLLAPTPVAVQEISRAGLNPVYTAASGDGNIFTNDGYTFAHIKNTGGVTVTATFDVVKTALGLAIADLEVAVPPTTGDVMVGPFPQEFFNDNTGKAKVTWSGTSDVTCAFLKMP